MLDRCDKLKEMKEHLLATEEEIDTRIAAIARKVIEDFADGLPLFVVLLRGAVPFASKLMFQINALAPDLHPEVDYMMIRTYGAGRKAGTPQVVADLTPETMVAGRKVMVIDDVLDKGITAQFVREYLRGRGATEVGLAVLAEKRTIRAFPIEPDYVGFSFSDEWLVGMGMDDGQAGKEYGRWRTNIVEMVE